MSHIYLYSPSGAVRDRAGFKRAVKRLQALGHQIEIDPDALSTWQRFAGDDATRLAAIGRAAASGADIVLTTRGGYGLTRLLPHLPYAAIQSSIERGSAWVGLSDFTALQVALLAQTGGCTWAGPALLEDWARYAPGQAGLAQALAQALLAATGQVVAAIELEPTPCQQLPANWPTLPYPDAGHRAALRAWGTAGRDCLLFWG